MKKVNPWREELALARRHRRYLMTVVNRLATMASEWDGLSGAMECDLNCRAEEMEKQVTVFSEQITEWAEGLTEKEDG